MENVDSSSETATPLIHKFQPPSLRVPQGFVDFINGKLENNGEGGRPHFLQVMAAQHRDVQNEVLNILEFAWIKNRSLGSIAGRYKTSYHTIYRLIHDLEPFKDPLVEYLLREPRRKTFYNGDLDTSDYETVQAYIRRAKRDGVKGYKDNCKMLPKVWKALSYKDPGRWTADEVVDYLSMLTDGMASYMLDAIRQVAPQIRDEVRTGRYREKIRRRKKDIFATEFKMMIEALRANNLAWEETVFKLHVALGAREGLRNPNAGMVGLSWDRFHKKFTRVDLWESKVRGGIWSRNCPLYLLFADLPHRLREAWRSRGKPTTGKVLENGYTELANIYKRIRATCESHWKGKTEPDILTEMATLKPHDADKIHVNLLWEAEVPLEVVAGQDLGRGEAVGLVGRVWLSVDTIRKYYLSLTQRSDRFKKLENKVREYSAQFAVDLR